MNEFTNSFYDKFLHDHFSLDRKLKKQLKLYCFTKDL